MKKTIYISGVIIVNLLLIGCIFKAHHWPGASIALILSLVLLSFWFLPVALLNHYKNNKAKTGKWIYISTFISFFIVFISALFKIQHWPGASILLMIGVPIPFLLFLPSFIFYSVKNKEQSFINFTAIILGLILMAVYSVLLSVNVSKDVLYQGIVLTKSNEKIIDYYQFTNSKLKEVSNDEMKQFADKSDRICDLIHQAKKDLLVYSENENINTDLGQDDFGIEHLNNLDSKTISKYVLLWKDVAMVPIIEKELHEYTKYINSLALNQETLSAVENTLNLENQIIDGNEYSWIEREFDSDYFVYALESLSRWEKNIRFIENIVLSDLVNKQTIEL